MSKYNNRLGCIMHGLINSSIKNIYLPFDAVTGKVLTNTFSPYAFWSCDVCENSGMCLAKDIYEVIEENKK